MSKRLEQMRLNPKADWTIADVEALCREHGLECLRSRAGSSHYKIRNVSAGSTLIVPFKRPIKSVYIRKLVEFVDEVRRHP